MTALIVYDSFFGNTKKAAEIIEKTLSEKGTVKLIHVKDFMDSDLQGADILFIGSPTRAFKASPLTVTAFKNLKPGALRGIKTAIFDTRMSLADLKNALLNFLVKLFGYAADSLEKLVKRKGGILTGESAGFYVKESEGPLKDGEEKRIADWAVSRL